MKKTFWRMSALILVLSLLTSCTLPFLGGGGPANPNPGTTPTLSDVQMQTQIPQLLTAMPTATGQPQAAAPTQPLPTVALVSPTQPASAAPSAYPAEVTQTPASPTNTPEAAAPADTAAPATATVAAASAATVIPTVDVTPVGGATATAGSSSGVPTVVVTPIATAAGTKTVQPAGPTFTPDAGDPRARLGSPTSTDPMDRATTWVWPTGSDQFTQSEFGSGVQTVTVLTGTDGWRMANPAGRDFGNLYLEATIKVGACSANDHYGLYVRVPVVHEPDQGYLFGFTCDGRYSLRKWDGSVLPKGQMTRLIDWKKSSAIAAGSNQINRMGIMTVGSRLILYANGKLLGEVSDAAYPTGYFGVFLGSQDTGNFFIQIDEMSYWENVRP